MRPSLLAPSTPPVQSGTPVPGPLAAAPDALGAPECHDTLVDAGDDGVRDDTAAVSKRSGACRTGRCRPLDAARGGINCVDAVRVVEVVHSAAVRRRPRPRRAAR